MQTEPKQTMNRCPHNPKQDLTTRRIHRWVLVSLGVACVGLAALGVFVPGLPVTIFLIVASACFTRSCPWLERRLLHNRLFRPYLKYLDGSTPMPRRARIIAISMMWTCIAASTALIILGDAPLWIAPVPAALGIVGTVFILRWRPAPRAATTAKTDAHAA